MGMVISFLRLKKRAKTAVKYFVVLVVVAFVHMQALADEPSASGTNSLAAPDSRFGLFDWLDHRSAYYQDAFPQPLLVDDTSLEQDGELELSSLHTQADGQQTDIAAAELQKSFDLLTLDLSVPYEWNSGGDDALQGVGNINLGARAPFYQYVSASGFFDTTLGVGAEIGIPVNSPVSKNTELDPELFNDLKLGGHFTLQSVLGYSTLFGGGESGGLQTFEYGFAFGWTIPESECRLSCVERFTPLFELSGETALNNGESGQNSLLGSAGFRLDLKAFGDLNPSIGLGYVFPIDGGARDEVHWGIATSLIFEF